MFPSLALQMTLNQPLMTSPENVFIFSCIPPAPLPLPLSHSLYCSVEFSRPRRCCSAQRDGEVEDEKKGEERKG